VNSFITKSQKILQNMMKVGNATLFNLSDMGRLEALNIIKTLRKENPINFMDLEEEITNKLNRIK